MLNKNGKGAVFIILIPIIFVIAAFLYDNFMMVSNNKTYREVTESIIKDVFEYNYDDKEYQIRKAYEEYKYDTSQLAVNYEDGVLTLYNVHTYPAFFGLILGVKSYRTEVHVNAYMSGNDVVIEDIVEEE